MDVSHFVESVVCKFGLLVALLGKIGGGHHVFVNGSLFVLELV